MHLSFRKISGLLVCLVLFPAVNCENEPLDEDFFNDQNTGCATAAQATANAALNFSGVNVDNYIQLCNAYRTALLGQIQACGDSNGALQATLNALGDCSEQTNDCETATNAASIAESALNTATADDYSELCNAYKTALQNKLTVCGDEDGSIQMEIDELGECEASQSASIIPGTWLLTAWVVENGLDLNNDGTESTNLLEEMDCYENETIVFNMDGTASINSTSFANFVVDIAVGTNDQFDFTIECIEEMDNSSGTWTENANVVTFIYDDFDEQLELTLMNNELSFLIPDGFFAQSEDGSIEILEDLTFIYTKQ